MSAYLWPILLLMLALGLAVFEVFLPSAGVLSILALLLGIYGFYLAFSTSTVFGFGCVVAVAVILPAGIGLAMKYWERSPFARWLALSPPEPEETGGGTVATRNKLSVLLGQAGRTLSPLRPSGTVVFEGRRHDAISESGLIASNTPIKAVAVRGASLVVRPLMQSEIEERAESASEELPPPVSAEAVTPVPDIAEAPDQADADTSGAPDHVRSLEAPSEPVGVDHPPSPSDQDRDDPFATAFEQDDEESDKPGDRDRNRERERERDQTRPKPGGSLLDQPDII